MLNPPFKSEKPMVTPEQMKQLLPLYNPLPESFVFPYQGDNNEVEMLTMLEGQITYFPTHIANYMAKHLADEMVNRGKEGLREQYLKEIWVKI